MTTCEGGREGWAWTVTDKPCQVLFRCTLHGTQGLGEPAPCTHQQQSIALSQTSDKAGGGLCTRRWRAELHVTHTTRETPG